MFSWLNIRWSLVRSLILSPQSVWERKNLQHLAVCSKRKTQAAVQSLSILQHKSEKKLRQSDTDLLYLTFPALADSHNV